MARRLDREAYGQVERTLGELQSQMSRQGTTWRSTAASFPRGRYSGLRIQRFEIQPGVVRANSWSGLR